jgi:ABC-type Na+ efflux pump permease subunit
MECKSAKHAARKVAHAFFALSLLCVFVSLGSMVIFVSLGSMVKEKTERRKG